MPDISFVIATYNSAPWLPSTLTSISQAVSKAKLSAEVVIVDDGSTDGTEKILGESGDKYSFVTKVIRQENKGRFLARWVGANAATSDELLIFDSRILLKEQSLALLFQDIENFHRNAAWNAHVTLDANTPLIGRFWEVPTYVFWGKYLGKPKFTILDNSNFDKHPKGTTSFLVGKKTFIEACKHAWPAENAHLTSDDTKILRFILQKVPIVLDPNFEVIYRPRTSLTSFLKHTFVRGTLFVDSYAGTSRSRNLILNAMSFLPAILIIMLIITFYLNPAVILFALVAMLFLYSIPVVIAAKYKCNPKSILSYYIYGFPFLIYFFAGIIRGRWVHRRNFSTSENKVQ